MIARCFSFAALAAFAVAASPGFRITTLSSRPDMVSGGDVLLRVDLPSYIASTEAVITVNGVNVTAAFHGEGASMIGLVRGLNVGDNQVEVSGGRAPVARLKLIDYPASGPIFSGPQEQPFVCMTEKFKLADGGTLGPPLDANCSAKTVVNYVYKSTEITGDSPGNSPGASRGRSRVNFKPLPGRIAIDGAQLPPDVAFTTTSSGRKVPYVVRIETGTLNRAIYQIAVLDDPTAEHAPSPFDPPKAWNRRLVYTFGGGCVNGWYKQGTSIGLAGGVIDDAIMSKGYAEASATLNVFGNNCNDVIAAETMMMVKERFIKTIGPPAMTLSEGGSGGAYQQIQIADNYPGLLDGIMPSLTFPDVMATVQILTDLQLLDNYFSRHADALTDSQKLAIAGVAELQNVTVAAKQAPRVNPSVFCPPELAAGLRYNAASNPRGARCDVFDHTVNVYGRDPVTGFARRPLDNVGVEYGLAALNAGKINVQQFLDLNAQVGGFDNDGNLVERRATADPRALRAAYRTGRVTSGRGGLGAIPIIDVRAYRDQTPAGDFHLKYHSFSLRERLRRANGTVANEVMLTGAIGNTKLSQYALEKLDEWVTRIQQDTSSDRPMEKIARAKPQDLEDACYAPNGDPIFETQTFAGGECNKLYPAFPSPRMVAGGPATNDVLKCQLKPIDMKDYAVEFTAEQKARLAGIFPQGVCNYAVAGVEQEKLGGTWFTY
ncbi:MAG TPA: DUF6351 family protein [Bryobacteraceae bacterium]|nr:DUF6351 family protein [Bryobacteraceae bacterium]